MICMAVTVPMPLPEQLAVEGAIHAALDHRALDVDWHVALLPLDAGPGHVLTVRAGASAALHAVLPVVRPDEIERHVDRLARKLERRPRRSRME